MKANDILKDLNHLALASRLKRLADQLLADAAKIHADSGETLQPGQFPLIAALDRYGPMTINDTAKALGISQPATTRAVAEAVKTGLVDSSAAEDDKRFREVSLTEEGRRSVRRMKLSSWPRVDAAARQLTKGLPPDFLESISEIERRLAHTSMVERVRALQLSILPFTDELAPHFHDINAEWIRKMFSIEPYDAEMLRSPRKMIIDKGGQVYFVQASEGQVIGTCAVLRRENGFFELTKMGVREAARGKGAGEFLLRFVLERLREQGDLDKLMLLSSKKNTAAIKLYEKLGFVHDQGIMERFGARYERCDVAMRYRAD